MILSMTGFGAGSVRLSPDTAIAVQISGVNRKQLEIRFSLPPELAEFETAARQQLVKFVSRGSLQVKAMWEKPGNQTSETLIDEALLEKLINTALAVRVRANLSREVNVEQLLAVPGVVGSKPQVPAQELAGAFQQALASALTKFNEMRSTEGANLATDLRSRLNLLKGYRDQLQLLTANQPEEIRKRLLEKLKQAQLPVNIDDPALLREILFYVDKTDVTEELTRLSSHFSQFDNFLAQTKSPGRDLDFLAQEIFREITTLGNKAASPAVSPIVVSFKAEMEKIREQIQNIE